MHSMTVSTSVLTDDAARADQRLTPALLLAGAAAGPLYVGVSLVQALTSDGFDVTRHPWSLLTNGNLGWIQVLNFLITGELTIACAEGMRRAHAGNLGPVPVAGFGLGMIAAGIFTADPMDGFPRGTPAGPPASISWHGILHLVCASLGFLAMIIACFSVRAPVRRARAPRLGMVLSCHGHRVLRCIRRACVGLQQPGGRSCRSFRQWCSYSCGSR